VGQLLYPYQAEAGWHNEQQGPYGLMAYPVPGLSEKVDRGMLLKINNIRIITLPVGESPSQFSGKWSHDLESRPDCHVEAAKRFL